MDSNPDGIKKICIYGIGGVGGYFGGKIAHKISQEANNDLEVFFIARGSHLHEIKENGLVLNTDKQAGLVCRPTLAAEKLAELPKPDLILVCVKGYDLAEVTQDIENNIHENTIIIPLLNGVDIYQRIKGALTKGIVLPACVYVATHIEKPGFITQKGVDGKILFGKAPQHPDFLPAEVTEFFDDMGIQYQWFDNSFPIIWEKYLFIAAFALVTASSGKSLGKVIADSILNEQVKSIMNEIVTIARHEGVDLKETVVAETMEKAKTFPCEARTSFQRDIEQNKPQNEGDLFGGTIIRMGRKNGVPTPVTEKIYNAIIN